jgi:hypothetical protein
MPLRISSWKVLVLFNGHMSTQYIHKQAKLHVFENVNFNGNIKVHFIVCQDYGFYLLYGSFALLSSIISVGVHIHVCMCLI